MESNGTSIFVVIFLAVLILSAVLIVWMFVSLVRSELEDERRQMIVGKASTWAFIAVVGGDPDRGDPDGGTAAQRGAGLPLYPAGNGGGGVCGLFGLVQAQVRRLSMENKIRALRSEMGLSQEELARRCGVSRQTINAIENNKYDPTLTLAFHLAGVLGTTVDELFLGPGEKSC